WSRSPTATARLPKAPSSPRCARPISSASTSSTSCHPVRPGVHTVWAPWMSGRYKLCLDDALSGRIERAAGLGEVDAVMPSREAERHLVALRAALVVATEPGAIGHRPARPEVQVGRAQRLEGGDEQ